MTAWLPWRVVHDAKEPRVEWLASDGAPFTEPFFEDTLRRFLRSDPAANSTAARRRTPLDVLRETAPGVALAGLVFHVSRCGSTLVSRVLAAPPGHVVVSEPPILDDLLRTSRVDPRVTDDERIAWLRGAVRALGPADSGGGGGARRLFVKLDSWHVHALPLLLRAFPEVPRLFVYRDPIEVLVSLMRVPSLTIVRGTVTPEELGVSEAERDRWTREEHAAAILGSFFRVARAYRSSLVPVAYDELPDRVWGALDALGWSDTDLVAMRAAAAFDAKRPGERFTPDAEAKRRGASPAIVAAVKRFTADEYARWRACV